MLHPPVKVDLGMAEHIPQTIVSHLQIHLTLKQKLNHAATMNGLRTFHIGFIADLMPVCEKDFRKEEHSQSARF